MTPLIAIISEDVGIRNALRALMRSASYRAETFPSAEDFVASEAATLSDCVITDVAMQGMSGLPLAALLTPRGWTVPAILISALARKGHKMNGTGKRRGCARRKPVESNALISLV